MNLITRLKQLCALPQKQRKATKVVQTAQWFEGELKQIYKNLDEPKR